MLNYVAATTFDAALQESHLRYCSESRRSHSLDIMESAKANERNGRIASEPKYCRLERSDSHGLYEHGWPVDYR